MSNQKVIVYDPPKGKKLTPMQHAILEDIKIQPCTTEFIMKKYNLTKPVQVRDAIQRIRRYKPGNTVIGNKLIDVDGKRIYAYYVPFSDELEEGLKLQYSRWKSSTETMLRNYPFVIGSMFRFLKSLESQIEKQAQGQIKAQLKGGEHDVHYTAESYKKR